jgi:hypothetical protein
MDVDTIKDKYDNAKTYANSKCMLKRINELLELKPYNYVHEHHYVDRFAELCDKMISSKFAKSKQDIIAKISLIIGLICRFDVAKCAGLRDKIREFKDDTTEIPVAPRQTVPSWESMLEMFDAEIQHNPNQFAKIVCIIYKHGYIVRTSDIYLTSMGDNRPSSATNFMDIENRRWHIREMKSNQIVGLTTINLSPEFVAELKPFISFQDYLLIYKTNFEPYRTNLLTTVGITSFTYNDIRWSHDEFTSRPTVLHGCEPHPSYLENPTKYAVNGKVRIIIKSRHAE